MLDYIYTEMNHRMKNIRRKCFMLIAAIVTSLCILVVPAPARDAGKDTVTIDPLPAFYADPAIPVLQLPTDFRTRRTSSGVSVHKDKPVEIFNVKGTGCIRHMWFVFGSQFNLDDVEIEITVDGATESQVRMPFRSFFGVLLDFQDYHIDSAGIAIFPNFTVTNDPLIPKKASPGWNCYMPIPFSKGCRILIYSQKNKGGASVVDWQQYSENLKLTPLRFYAQRNIALPAKFGQPFPIAETQGNGFLAGYIMGWRQKDHNDMVFHNSGIRMFIDGQTDPHVICGYNVEDDFGFSWGFNQYQSRWAGCPYRDNRSRFDQDGVYYRFFGPDPIRFRSSLIFTSSTRPDDYEAVSYLYKVPGSRAPQVVSPEKWQAVGPFRDGHQLDAFKQSSDEVVQKLSTSTLPEKIIIGTAEYTVRNLGSRYGWLRLGNVFHESRPAYPLTNHSVYVGTTLETETRRQATLRLCLDNWAIVYLNGRQVAMLDHSDEFETARIPIVLKKGDNRLVIKTNNQTNHDVLAWAINCVVE